MAFELDETFDSGINIKVLGIGGGGCNAADSRRIRTAADGGPGADGEPAGECRHCDQ